jgi:hypothetical protein
VFSPRVADHDPLGPSGGPGGVDQVRQVLRPRPPARRPPPRPAAAGDGVGLLRAEHRGPGRDQRLQARAQVRLRQQHRHRGVLQQQGQALGRVGGVERQVGAAGVQHPEQRDHQLGAALHADPHRHLGPDAQRAQPLGERPRAGLQLRVVEPALALDDGRGVRGAGGLRRDELVDAGAVRDGRIGAVPLRQQAPALGRGEQRQRGEAGVGVGDDPLQQHLEVGGQPLHRCRLEQLGAVLDPASRAPARSPSVEGGGRRWRCRARPETRTVAEPPAGGAPSACCRAGRSPGPAGCG